MIKKYLIPFTGIALLILIISVVARQTVTPIHDVPDGHILVNNNPGVIASAETTRPSGDASLNTVVATYGAGDAYLTYRTWPYNDITGHAKTWLEQGVSSTFTICARVEDLTVGNTNSSNNFRTCNSNAGSGDSVHQSLGPLEASCNEYGTVETDHYMRSDDISFFWDEPDSDMMQFCVD